MKRTWAGSAAFALALVATGSARAGQSDALAVAARFVAALVKDRPQATAMIAADAQMGFGDVGGPFDITLFDTAFAQCRFDLDGATVTPLGMEGREIEVVRLHLACPDEHDVVRARTAELMIEHDKVAGLYLP